MAAKDKFDIEQELIAKFRAISPKDLAAMTLGAFLGYHGYTPLTALIGLGKDIPAAVQNAQRNFEASIAELPGPAQAFLGIINTVLPVFGLITGSIVPPQPRPPTPAIQKAQAAALMAALGAFEALVLVQPGALQGIGEIIPL